MKTAELINGDSLNRRLNQTNGALSPIRLKQNPIPAHHYPVINFVNSMQDENKTVNFF
ncbi:MAG: hypothetical protein WCQ95_14600 [Bacteroidota bacterium]